MAYLLKIQFVRFLKGVEVNFLKKGRLAATRGHIFDQYSTVTN